VSSEIFEKIRQIISEDPRLTSALRSCCGLLWSTGGLFIKWNTLTGTGALVLALLFAMLTVAILHET
jgi:hypothetical protein